MKMSNEIIKRPVGRPRKTDEEREAELSKERKSLEKSVTFKIKQDNIKKAIVKAIREKGCTIKEVCAVLKISPGTIQNYTKEDPEFAMEINNADQCYKLELIESIKKASIKDWRAGAFLLQKRYPQEFSDKSTVEVEQKGSGSQVVVNLIQQVLANKNQNQVIAVDLLKIAEESEDNE